MRLNMLGNIEVLGSDGAIIPLGGDKERALLALLGTNQQMRVSAERLIDALWESALPKDPTNALRHYVARLRSKLDPDRTGVLETVAGGYVLHLSTDVHLVETAAGEGRGLLADGQPEAALACFDRALDQWRGDPLADVADFGFAQAEISRLTELRDGLVDNRYEAGLACQLHEELIPELTAALARDPLRERLCALLMLALYRSGRQADALRAYQQARKATIERLGLEPSPELGNLEEQILLRDPALNQSNVRRSGGNIPTPATPFVGRVALVDQIVEHLEHYRMITLIGPSGIGKTRIAIEVLSRDDGRPRGTWFVDLDGATAGTMLETTTSQLPVSRVTNPDLLQALLVHFETREALIVFDGCERVSDVVADATTALLDRCPDVRILTTSQHTLGTPGEVAVHVPPLELGASPQSATGYSEAVELFVERAQRALPGVAVTDDLLDAATRICAAVDGLPLAIELAAARLTSLNPQQIEAGLVDRFTLLTQQARHLPARHRSLHAALDWTVGLLDNRHRKIVTQLGVFSGPFDTNAIVSVLDLPPSDTRDAIRTLIDFSLLRRGTALKGDAAYRQLDSVRDFARQSMTTSEFATLRRKHAEYYASLAHEADRGLKSSEHALWLERTDAASENLRWAIETATSGIADADVAIQLVARLSRYWDWIGSITEARQWLDRALLLDSDHPDRALALLWSSYFHVEAGDTSTGRRDAEAAIDCESDEHQGPAFGALSLVERADGNLLESYRLANHAALLAHQRGQTWFSAWAQTLAAMAALDDGNPTAALEHGTLAQSMFSRLSDRRGEAWCVAIQALATAHETSGRQEAGNALLLAHEAGDQHTMEWMLRLLAMQANDNGLAIQGVRLLSSAQSLADRRGSLAAPAVLGDQNQLREELASQLGPDSFTTAWEQGKQLALDDALQVESVPAD